MQRASAIPSSPVFFRCAGVRCGAALLVVAASSLLTGCGDDDTTAPPAAPVVPAMSDASAGAGSIRELTLTAGWLDTGEFDAATYDAHARLAATTMAFRRIEAPRVASSASLTSAPSAGHAWYLACFETTQGQWQQIVRRAGFTDDERLMPWRSVAPPSVLGSAPERAELPACGISFSRIKEVLTAYNSLAGTNDPTLRLPTASEWEYACRAGSSGPYAWGESREVEDVSTYAVVRETRVSNGADVVGGRGATLRQPNAFGLFDMHGNVWELVTSEHGEEITGRGGSWSDNLISASSASITPMDRELPYALAGLRLVLVLR